MSRRMDKHGLLNPGQYGGTPNRCGNDAVFVEEMQYEIGRLSLKPALKMHTDVGQCFDNNVPSASSLANQAYGTPSTVAQVMTRPNTGKGQALYQDRPRNFCLPLYPQPTYSRIRYGPRISECSPIVERSKWTTNGCSRNVRVPGTTGN